MNILYTAYYGLGKGGAEVSMSLLAREIRNKHNILIASTDEYNGFKTYKFNKNIRYLPNLNLQNRYMAGFFSKIIKEEKIDIIHSHDSKTAIAAIMAAKKNNIKSVTHYRDYWFCCPRSSLLKPNMTRCENCDIKNLRDCYSGLRLFWNSYKLEYLKKCHGILKAADSKIAISNAVDGKLKMIGIDDAKIIPNGIDLSMFKNIKSRPEHNLRDTNIGYIGSLSYNKGLQKITGIIKDVLRVHKKAKFIITGDGELRNAIEKEFIKFKEMVIFNGQVSYEDMITVYNELDIVLIPSLWEEPFSRVAIEAMAAGKPIIAANTGGLNSIIKDEFGYLIDINKQNDWGDAIDLLVSKPLKRKMMGINALRESKKYDIKCIAKEINDIYEENKDEKNTAGMH